MLMSIAEMLTRLHTEIAELRLAVRRTSEYAEQTSRLHHSAISRLSQASMGTLWPPRDPE